MKLTIDVKDRQEREAIRRALTLPDVRACVITVGVLDALPSDRARARVLRYVADAMAEEAETSAAAATRAALAEAEAEGR